MKTAADLEQFIDAIGLRHFKGRELTPYWSRVRGRVRNTVPPETLWPNIVPTLLVLDEIRAQLGVPIDLLSTYRSPAYNRAVGGERGSYHMQFSAVDFSARGVSPRAVAAVVRKLRGRRFTLPNRSPITDHRSPTFIFRGGLGVYATFVHVDTRGYDANWYLYGS